MTSGAGLWALGPQLHVGSEVFVADRASRRNRVMVHSARPNAKSGKPNAGLSQSLESKARD
jgi:hypothetical protein